MNTFRFHALSEEGRAKLRRDERRCIEALRACQPLVSKLAREAGIYTPLDSDEEQRLQAFHEVSQAFEGPEYEGAFDRLRKQAGLRPSDVGLLTGRVETLYWEREPAQAQAEIIAMLHQWFLGPEEPQHE
jgi:hypothetical protein